MAEEPVLYRRGREPQRVAAASRNSARAFEAAGFAEIRQRCQSGIAYREVAPRGINALLSIYNAADRVFEAVGLGRWFGTFVLTCGRKPLAENE